MVDMVGRKHEKNFLTSVGLIPVLGHYPVEYVTEGSIRWPL
jgi:hypothetical protein